MAPPHKGKAPTKGSQQIFVENIATVYFYRNMAIGATCIHGLITLLLSPDNFTTGAIVLNVVVIAIYLSCHYFMKYISRATYSDNYQLIDPGVDLNMEGGVGEHVKDIVILSSITHLLAALSSYFWLLLLLLPLRAAWLLWTNLLGPWFFQEAPQDTEQDEKKRKKLDRKMKRYQQ